MFSVYHPKDNNSPKSARIVRQVLEPQLTISDRQSSNMHTHMLALNRIKRFINQVRYTLGLTTTFHPAQGGVEMYRKKSSWPLRYEMCPCDSHLVDYLKKEGVQDKVIFHFGTGEHHYVGLENAKLSSPNHVVGITATEPEHSAFVDFVSKNRGLAKYYTVLFKDIYAISAEELPFFDYISLFHLCEFYLPGEVKFVHHDDRSLLELFHSRLNPGGRLLFYRGSFAWDRSELLVKELVRAKKILKVENFESLSIYEKIDP